MGHYFLDRRYKKFKQNCTFRGRVNVGLPPYYPVHATVTSVLAKVQIVLNCNSIFDHQ